MEIIPQERSWVELNLAAFAQNLDYLKSYLKPHQGFMQIVKADAYGHGAREIGELALKKGALYLGVANLEEGKLLRTQGVMAPILILSPSLESEIAEIIEYDLQPGVSDYGFALAFSQAAAPKPRKVHIKLDSGMHRSGLRMEEALEVYRQIATLPYLQIEGVFSHFASAENDPGFSRFQEAEFGRFVSSLSPKPKYIHINNSAACIRGYGDFSNLVRFGILSFGINTTGDPAISQALKPVMSFKSRISQIKDIKKGESIGYNRDWIAEQDGKYAVIPVGYADGYDYLLSNRAKALVNGLLCNVIGRISMDMITIDISAVPEAKTGDSVCLLGEGDESIKAESLTGLYKGSAYELLCQIGRRARRYYVDGGSLLYRAPMSRRDFVADDFADGKLSEIISKALAQRLRSKEMGNLIYRDILRSFFANKDRDLHYRKDFVHEVSFLPSEIEGYYRVKTTLSYRKVLDNERFIIACARSDAELRRYFIRREVEYRWLLDEKLALNEDSFCISAARVNGIELNCQVKQQQESLEIHCSHPHLKELMGQELLFEIDTDTLYPKDMHQFSVFISELTQGVKIAFNYPDEIRVVQPVTVFSGKQKNPPISFEPGRIVVESSRQNWVFPLSGVVFSY